MPKTNPGKIEKNKIFFNFWGFEKIKRVCEKGENACNQQDFG